MDENTKDILLVLLGAAASLVGSVLTLVLENRRERAIAKRERQVQENERLIAYLFSISKLYSLIVNHLSHQSTNNPVTYSHEQFIANTRPVMEQISQSPISGLPPLLMTRDKAIADKVAQLNTHLMEANLLVNMIGSGRYRTDDPELTKEQIQKFSAMNTIINDVINELEKKLG